MGKKNEMKGCMQFFVFFVNKQKFAIPLESVEKVIQAVEICSLPHTPGYMAGIINMHGEVIPVINMHFLFGWESGELDITDQFIIVLTSKFKFALWVDSTQGIIEAEDENILQSERIQYEEKFVQGIVKLENGMVLISDADKFFSKKELEDIESALKHTDK